MGGPLVDTAQEAIRNGLSMGEAPKGNAPRGLEQLLSRGQSGPLAPKARVRGRQERIGTDRTLRSALQPLRVLMVGAPTALPP